MSNIDKFDEYAGRILGLLYNSFPVPMDLAVPEVLDLAEMYNDGGLPPECDEDFSIAACTISWLQDAGYINFKGSNGCDFFLSVLTEKGLEVLKSTPESLSPSSASLGQQINSTMKAGGKEVLRALVNQAFAIGIKIMAHRAGYPA